MTDDPNALTQEQRDKIAAFLNQKGARLPCPACGNTTWTVGNHVLRSDIFSLLDNAIIIGGVTYPLVFVVCDRCHFIRMHSALMAGIIVPPKPNAEPEIPPTEGANG